MRIPDHDLGSPFPYMLFWVGGYPQMRKSHGKEKVLIIDASREFEQGTNQNRLREQDIEKIVETFRKKETVEKYSYSTTYVEIEENEFNLNIPRYVDTFEPEPEIDIDAVQKQIEEIEANLVETRAKMKGYLKELGF